MTHAQTKQLPDNNGFGEMIAEGTLCIERILPGPVERVWAYLTETDKRKQWLAGGVIEPREGGKVALEFDNSNLTPYGEVTPERFKDKVCGGMGGSVLVWDPPKRLAYTWGQQSEVMFELTPRGEQVELIITHRKLPSRADMLSVGPGWHTHVGVLIDVLNGETPEPFWPTFLALEKDYDKIIPRD